MTKTKKLGLWDWLDVMPEIIIGTSPKINAENIKKIERKYGTELADKLYEKYKQGCEKRNEFYNVGCIMYYREGPEKAFEYFLAHNQADPGAHFLAKEWQVKEALKLCEEGIIQSNRKGWVSNLASLTNLKKSLEVKISKTQSSDSKEPRSKIDFLISLPIKKTLADRYGNWAPEQNALSDLLNTVESVQTTQTQILSQLGNTPIQPTANSIEPQTIKCLHCGSSCSPGNFCSHCQEPLWNFDANKRLDGKYSIISKIGEGGMGQVHLAEDYSFQNDDGSYVKCVIKTASGKDFDKDAFKREASILRNLKHAGLPKVYAVYSDDSKGYIVMDYVEGKTLEQILQENLSQKKSSPIDEKTVAEYAIMVCDILEYLHSQPIPVVHRDIKPQNLILEPSGTNGNKKANIVAVDFGIAKQARKSKKTSTALGTPGYAAPEQYNGLAEPRSDLYSLGAVMYHLLTGVDLEKYSFFPPKLRDLNPKLSEGIEQIVTRATELKAEDRFKNAAEMKSYLEKCAAGEKIELYSENSRAKSSETKNVVVSAKNQSMQASSQNKTTIINSSEDLFFNITRDQTAYEYKIVINEETYSVKAKVTNMGDYIFAKIKLEKIYYSEKWVSKPKLFSWLNGEYTKKEEWQPMFDIEDSIPINVPTLDSLVQKINERLYHLTFKKGEAEQLNPALGKQIFRELYEHYVGVKKQLESKFDK